MLPNPQFLLNYLMQSNPGALNNPMAKEILSVIQRNDVQKGEEIARNICNAYGITPEQAMQQAMAFISSKLPFTR